MINYRQKVADSSGVTMGQKVHPFQAVPLQCCYGACLVTSFFAGIVLIIYCHRE
jgi:hypothetical protein